MNGSVLRILVSPLDWGLGHATRCIPIIRALLDEGCEVIVGADKETASLLKKEFPALLFIKIRGYGIRYSSSKKLLILRLLLQVPAAISRIWKENRQVRKIVRQHGISAVISDNRPGMFSKIVPSIYITHQVNILTGNPVTDRLAGAVHRFFIKKFIECWIPDNETNGIAGKLSHGKHLPANAKYTGCLSRFSVQEDLPVVYSLMISLSGPEPQRTIFETILLKQIAGVKNPVLLVRGLPSSDEVLQHHCPNLTVRNHLDAGDYQRALYSSDLVLARSGYTTVMDLLKTGRKAILVPTPGQTEQEYLAKHLSEKEYFLSAQQDDFGLAKLLNKAKSFRFLQNSMNDELYTQTIRDFVRSVETATFAQ